MNFDFKTGMILSILALIISSTGACATNSTLPSERLKFYQAIRAGKPGMACNYTLPSSQDAVILVFPQRASQPMLILKSQQTLLVVNSSQGPKIIGAVQSSPTVHGAEFIRSLFHGQQRVICGVFKVPAPIWTTPMTYYAFDGRQGQVISGMLSRQGTFTRVMASNYEYDGPPFRLPSFPGE